jgi:hypoxanthine-guanine phosphoribosyltransferase
MATGTSAMGAPTDPPPIDPPPADPPHTAIIYARGKARAAYLLYTPEQMKRRLAEIAKLITDDPIILCIREGAKKIHGDLVDSLDRPVRSGFLDRPGKGGQKEPCAATGPEGESISLEGQHIVIVDDVGRSGDTVMTAFDYLLNVCKAASVRVVMMFHQAEITGEDVEGIDPRLVGFLVGEADLAGYGIGLPGASEEEQEHNRALPAVYAARKRR